MSLGPLRLPRICGVAALAAAVGCGSHDALQAERRAAAAAPEGQVVGATPPAEGRAEPPPVARPRIVALGDSLTAGLGLSPDQAYPALLQQRLTAEGFNYEVVNAGVSGDTSAGGRARFDWAVAGDVQVLIIALGGNDGLRGLPVQQLKQNLSQIIERARARHITVVLAGMEAPPNHGWEYVVDFHQVFPDLAQKYHVAFVPFLLQGVAGHDELNQRDGIHPTAQGAGIVADTVWAALKPILEAQPRTRVRGDGPPGS
jgi:acyl-CoA thioesterase-1